MKGWLRKVTLLSIRQWYLSAVPLLCALTYAVFSWWSVLASELVEHNGQQKELAAVVAADAAFCCRVIAEHALLSSTGQSLCRPMALLPLQPVSCQRPHTVPAAPITAGLVPHTLSQPSPILSHSVYEKDLLHAAG